MSPSCQSSLRTFPIYRLSKWTFSWPFPSFSTAIQIQIIEHFLVITLHCLHFCVHVTAYNPTPSMASVVSIWPDPLTDHGLARFKSMCSIPKNRKPLSTFSSYCGVLNSNVFQICHYSILILCIVMIYCWIQVNSHIVPHLFMKMQNAVFLS